MYSWHGTDTLNCSHEVIFIPFQNFFQNTIRIIWFRCRYVSETVHRWTTANSFTSCFIFVEIKFRSNAGLTLIVLHLKNVKDLACNDMVTVKSYPSGPDTILTSTVWYSNKINRPTSHGAICRQPTAYFTSNISVLMPISQQTTLHQTYQCYYQYHRRPRYTKHISVITNI